MDIARQLEDQGKWLEAYSRYSYLATLDKTNSELDKHADELLRRATLVAMYVQDPNQDAVTWQERRRGINFQMIRKGLKVLKSDYVVKPNFKEMIDKALQYCLLIAKTQKLSDTFDQLNDPQTLSDFRDEITAFEPTTGKQIWTCKGLGPQILSTPIIGEGMLVALAGIRSTTLAVRLGGSGDVTDTHTAWTIPDADERLGTGVIHDGHLYANKINGIMQCIDLESGDTVWQKRLAGTGRDTESWSSLFLSDGKIYAMNKSADVFVIEASPEYKLLATNSIGGERTNSTVVGSQGNLFIRTHDALWCIGE